VAVSREDNDLQLLAMAEAVHLFKRRGEHNSRKLRAKIKASDPQQAIIRRKVQLLQKLHESNAGQMVLPKNPTDESTVIF
jgi:hypothetical protein